MKNLLTLAFLLLAGSSFSQTHSLVKKWETDSLLKTPESVLYVEKDKILYVSNIDGTPDGKDGKGSIGKVALDGKIIKTDWVTGLNAPKGMGLYKNKLYVADLTEVVIIDVTKGAIIKKIPIEGSVFLNDITIDREGIVYVTDSRTLKLHSIEKDNIVITLLENLKGPNGVLSVGDELMLLDKGTMFRLLHHGQLLSVAEGMDPSTDGIEMVKKNEYIVSCWSGIVYYIDATGNKQVLLDTRDKKINSADIGYDAKNRILYVPTFYKNSIVAYQVL